MCVCVVGRRECQRQHGCVCGRSEEGVSVCVVGVTECRKGRREGE